ncbi:MAG: hypothetical protein ACXWQO_19325, partial [Bdellovibrionota bacterium]
MKNTSLLLLAFFCASETAYSAEKKIPLTYCTPATSIRAEVCEDNDAFIKEGDNCLTKLENEVKAASQTMKTAFSDNKAQQQNKKFNSALQDNSVGSMTLAYLLSLTDVATADVKKYQVSLSAPEDADEAEVNEGNPEAYSMKVDCYGDTKKSLDGVLSDISHVKNDLLAAKKIADANAAISNTHEQQVNTGSGQALIKDTAKTAPAIKGIQKT